MSSWLLDHKYTHLNHGSFGACPLPVLEEQQRWRSAMESNPVRFFTQDLQPALDEARRRLAWFVGAEAESLAFVSNATAGVNAVLSSLDLGPGDEILLTDHTYNACRNIANVAAMRSGATLVEASVPFPTVPADYARAVLDRVGPATKLVLIDAVTSPTALIVPFAEIVAELEPDVAVLVDAAHAPGMIPLDLATLGASYVVGNCHKWMCAPKGAGFLYAREDQRKGLLPAAVSHGWNTEPASGRSRYHHMFDWTGTDDPSARLSVPAAIATVAGMLADGWSGVMAHNHRLAVAGWELLSKALGIEPGAPGEAIGSMATLVLPGDSSAGFGEMDPLTMRLREEWQIEVPVFPWRDWSGRLIRISAQLYNKIADYERLATALRSEL